MPFTAPLLLLTAFTTRTRMITSAAGGATLIRGRQRGGFVSAARPIMNNGDRVLRSRSLDSCWQSQFQAEDETESNPKGSCSQVDYADLDLPSTELVDLPFNELMLELSKPSFVCSPNPFGPTIVSIGLYVDAIGDIDPERNSFLLEGFLDLTWCDSRLKFNVSDTNVVSEMFLEEDAAKELEIIWWPDIYFVNEIGKRQSENRELIIDQDGTVEYREKFGVTLGTNYNMKSFPFDTQVLLVEIESFAWSSDILQFHIEDGLVGFSQEFEVPEFKITKLVEYLEDRQEYRDRTTFSELVAEIHVARDPVYYVLKVIIPLTMIVFVSWAVFWMPTENLAERMGISFTGVLTSVAYQFIVAESLPRHIYNTFLDLFVILSFSIMVLTIVENVVVHMLSTSTKELNGDGIKKAKRVDNMCKIGFPLLFAISVGTLALTHLDY